MKQSIKVKTSKVYCTLKITVPINSQLRVRINSQIHESQRFTRGAVAKSWSILAKQKFGGSKNWRLVFQQINAVKWS
jgi:hypothetical protein